MSAPDFVPHTVSIRLDQIAGIADCISTLAMADQIDTLKAGSLCSAAMAIGDLADEAAQVYEETMEAFSARLKAAEPASNVSPAIHLEPAKKPRLVPIRKTAPADAEPEHAQ